MSLKMSAFIGSCIKDVPTPAFVVDLKAVERNCNRMIKAAEDSKIALRPHVKTHKSVEGAILQTGGSKRRVVSSTMAETEMLVKAEFDNILYGVPLVESHLKRNFDFMNRLNSYHVFVNNFSALESMLKFEPPKKKWSVFIPVDCGYPREGIWHEDDELIIKMASKIVKSDKIDFKGKRFAMTCTL